MSLFISRRRALTLVGTVLVFGCNEQQLQQGFAADQTPPSVTIQKPDGDTLQVAGGISFAINAIDNLGLKDISVALTVGFDFQFDTTLASAVTDLTLSFGIPLPVGTTAGGTIVITATVADGNNNITTAVDSVFLENAQALTVRILDPTPGGVTAPGLSIPVNIQAIQETGIRRIGYTATGVVTTADSMDFALPDTALFSTTLAVPGNAAVGTFSIVGFAQDSSGRRVTSSPVSVNVQSVVTDTDPPFVTFIVADRVEVTDSIIVTATDASGISSLEWTATSASSGAAVGGATLPSSGTLTQVTGRFPLNFTFTTFPQLVEIRAFATDAAGNRGEARADTAVASAIFVDTITVVNGITKPLPAGGTVADAVFNPNQNEFYLTNRRFGTVRYCTVAA